MTVTVRFAPSPTGLLHVGNIRPAVLNWLFALECGGSLILRFDDTDRERSSEAFVDAARRDLAWLGLTWQREERQSARTDRYAAAAELLRAAGRLYPCYESEDELERRRARLRARGLPPIYDRAALKLTDAERAEREAAGIKPHWRFLLANAPPGAPLKTQPTAVVWQDLVRGEQSVDVGSLSDPVLVRADGTFLYTFTSVVDDIEFAVSHIIRGEDHVTNTGVQIQLFEALGAAAPRFAHHSLLVAADGQALSKRSGALSVASLREDGLEPMAILSHAALVGTSNAIEPYADPHSLAGTFAFEKLSRAPARFDPAELVSLNARLIQTFDFATVADRLAALGVGGGAAFWLAIRANLTRVAEAAEWWAVVSGEIVPIIEDRALCEAAASLLPEEPFDAATWTSWTNAVKTKTGAKARALFHPLRLALTGREAGPELRGLLPFIGRDRALRRLLND